MPVTSLYATRQAQTQGIPVLRAAAALPQTALGTIFNVVGDVELLDCYARVTTPIQAQPTAIKLRHTPTGGTVADVSGTVDINGAAVGATIQFQGPTATGALTQAPTLANNTGGLGKALGEGVALRLGTGALGLNTAASSTGALAFGVRYRPLTSGARITPA